MRSTEFGRMPDGEAVPAWTLGRPDGLTLTVTGYGARIVALHLATPGGPRNVVLGHDGLDAYRADRAYLGSVPGRYANRIRDGRFVLDGRAVQVTTNNGGNMLHGGTDGFAGRVWTGAADGEDAMALRLTSPDGDQGFPGTLHAQVRYSVTDLALRIDYLATAEAPTVLNLTNHAYFNLDGAADILGHELSVAADRFSPTDAGQIPTGERRPVAGTPFDFRVAARIGARIEADDEQLRLAGGYDHNFILADAMRSEPAHAATLAAGGIRMEVLTDQPGVQVYSGNSMPQAGLPMRGALCLETQHFPDSPNHPDFPSTVLRPGETFRSTTIYRFTAS